MFTKRIGNNDNLIKEITDRILLKLKKSNRIAFRCEFFGAEKLSMAGQILKGPLIYRNVSLAVNMLHIKHMYALHNLMAKRQ